MARVAVTPAATAVSGSDDALPGARRPGAPAWSVPLALAAALLAVTACRAREGDRCVCAEDCREGLVCVAAGRVLDEGECSPAVGQESTPGVCLSEDEAALDGGGDGMGEPFMDLGSKLDFTPGPPPDPDTEGASGTAGATTEATGSTGTGSTGETTETTGSSGSTGGTTDATGSSSTGTGSTT
jgi:hypothetical protein